MHKYIDTFFQTNHDRTPADPFAEVFRISDGFEARLGSWRFQLSFVPKRSVAH